MQDDFGYLDKFLWSVSGDPLEQPIWSDITSQELETIVEIILKRGQRSPVAAESIRHFVNASDYIVAFNVVLPRVRTTAQLLRQTRKSGEEENGTTYQRRKPSRFRRRGE